MMMKMSGLGTLRYKRNSSSITLHMCQAFSLNTVLWFSPRSMRPYQCLPILGLFLPQGSPKGQRADGFGL